MSYKGGRWRSGEDFLDNKKNQIRSKRRELQDRSSKFANYLKKEELFVLVGGFNLVNREIIVDCKEDP